MRSTCNALPSLFSKGAAAPHSCCQLWPSSSTSVSLDIHRSLKYTPISGGPLQDYAILLSSLHNHRNLAGDVVHEVHRLEM